MIQIEENAYRADTGKVFKNINSGAILGNEIWFGTNDNISNYIEIDAPIPEEEPIPEPEVTITELNTEVTEVRAALDEFMTVILPTII